MNPDYYKTKEKKLYKHEFDRVKSMTDDNLKVRYDKMTKPDKIGAFYEALTDENRAPKLRKNMEGNHGIVAKKNKEFPTVEFVKVLKNEDDGDGTACKQAIFFQPESGKHYLYSYVNNENTHETMFFECDEDGDSDMKEVAVAQGYEHSEDMVTRLSETLQQNA